MEGFNRTSKLASDLVGGTFRSAINLCIIIWFLGAGAIVGFRVFAKSQKKKFGDEGFGRSSGT